METEELQVTLPPTGRFGLSGYALKYIAMVSMLCDHANLFLIRRGIFARYISPEGYLYFGADAPAALMATQKVYRLFEVLGHIGFPLFVFLITEGFVHTRSKKRYLLTIAACAVVTEPIYDYTHYGVFWSWKLQNVLFTFVVCVAELWVLEFLEKNRTGRMRWVLTALTVLVAGGAAFAVRSEYVFLGTTAAALFYLLREKNYWRLLGLAPLLAVSPWVLLTALPLACYGGQRGRRGSKYFFYVFYPAHFLVLLWLGQWIAGAG